MACCQCGCGGETKLEIRGNSKRGVKIGDPRRYIRGHHQKLPRPDIEYGVYQGDDVAYVPTTQGKWAIVNVEDLPLVSGLWCYSTQGYVVRNERRNGKLYSIRMHRLITNAPPDKDVDHENGDTLDHRRRNLRISSTQQNIRNQRAQEGRSSKYKGVSANRVTGKFEAYITIAKIKIHLGLFKMEEDAAIAYNKAAIRNFGEFARLNII